MAEHKVIDRRKAAADRESVAERLAAAKNKQGVKKQKTPAPAVSAPAVTQNQSRGSYYSPREYGTQAQTLGAKVETARKAMEQQTAALEQSRKAMEELRTKATTAQSRYYDLKGKFRGADAAKYDQQLLDEYNEATRQFAEGQKTFQAAYDAYKPYEDAYNQAVGAYKGYMDSERAAYGEWKSTIRDGESIRAEQKELKEKRAELESLMKRNNMLQLGNRDHVTDLVIASNEERIRELQEYLGGVGEREKLLQEELGWSEHFLFEGMRENADFAAMRGADGSVQDSRYRYVNDPAFRTEYQTQLIQADPGAIIPRNDLYEAGLDMMTDEERALYNYVYNTGGKEQAERYLATIANDLIGRKAQQEFARMQGNTFAEVAFGAPAGVDSFEQGLKGWFGGAAPSSIRQVLGGMAREDLGNAGWKLPDWMGGASMGQMAYDTVNTSANMAPSILAGTIGQMVGLGGVGTLMLGASAGGNARQEALREGYSEGQATAYGAMVGAAEAVMEKLLGGISSLGGKGIGRFTNGRFTAFLNKLDSAFLRTAAEVGEKMVSEGTEEYLQEILDPILRNAALGEENELELVTPEALYSGLLGAMTGGLMEAPGIVSKNRAAKRAANNAANQEKAAQDAAETVPEGETVEAEEPGVVDSKMETTTSAAGVAGEGSATAEGSLVVDKETLTPEKAASPEGIVLPKVEPMEQNGGRNNGEEAGERVLPGGPERHDTAGAGESSGTYEVRREAQREEARSQAQAAAQRRVKAENLERRGQLQRVSAQELGLRQGTEVRELLELPRYEWDNELYDTVSRLEKETGYRVRCVTGNIGMRLKHGGVGLAKGYIDRVNKTIVLNVCHSQVTAGQIADHELWHHKMDTVGRIGGDRYEVTRLAAQRIQEEYSPEDFDEVLEAYIDGYGDVYDQSDWEGFLNRVYEEIMADAYAGINAFGTEAARFRGTVDDTMDELGMGRNMWNAQEQEDAPAPGGDRRVYYDEDAPPMPEYEDYSQVPEYDWSGFDENEVDFSIEELPDGKKYVRADRQVIMGNDPDSWSEQIEAYINGKIRRGGDVKLLTEDGEVLLLTAITAGKLSDYHDSHGRTLSDDAFYLKANAAVHIDELTATSVKDRTKSDVDGRHGGFASKGWQYRTAFFQDFDGKYYRVSISAAQGENGNVVYNIGKIERRSRPTIDGSSARSGALGEKTSSIDMVSRNDDKVNGNDDTWFSLEQPVEETKTLIAMHNLTEEKLEKAIALGGFPMPSIAVTRADIPHTNFGEITLVMDKSTVDPKADRRNDVYSADAWTPTFPRTEYEVNSEAEDRVRRTLQELERKIAPQFQGNLRRVMYGLEDLLNSYDGEENLIGHVLDNDGLKAVYLESQGKHINEVQVEKEVPKRYNQAAQDKYEAIIAALGTRDPAEIGTMPLKDIRDNFGAELEKIVPGISKTSLRLSRFMQQTIDYLMDDGNGPETEAVVDQNATRQAMEDALDRDGYEAWVRELFSGIEGDKGIHNGKERFTPSGRRRSFQQTHLPVTLDNIVKAMAAQNGGNTKNVSGFNGVKTLRAGTAQRFKSIQGMHELEGRLQNLSEEEQTALTDGLQHRLYELIDEIDRETGRRGGDNSLIRFDVIGQIITEASETGRYNVADIQRVFRENHHEIGDELAMKVKELLFDVSQMPVNLFEAKPRRAVRFDEVRAAIVPTDITDGLRTKLEQTGVPVVEYERGNKEDRVRKVNGIDDVRFSVDDALSREEYDRLMSEVAGDQSKRNEEFVKGRLTPEQYKQFKQFQREDNLDAHAEARVRGIERFEKAMEQEELNVLRAQQAEDAAAGRRELKAEEKAAAEAARKLAQMARQDRKDKAEKQKEQARKEAGERIRKAGENAPTGSKPTIARKELQDKLIGLFSVGDGQRAELRRMIGELADRMLMEGRLDETDLRTLINRLYDSGVMVIEPEEIYAEGRSYLKDEHIYISPEQIRELGDDWLTLRKKAWGLGVYLTTNRQYAGLDVWNADMASYLPGLFNENETDNRTILDRLLMIAEEGKAEKISLMEYTKRIAKAEHQSEQALLENLERQVEEALRTFAEKASLETRLKDRNARRRAMDREEAAIARETDRAEMERRRQDLRDDREALREQNTAERKRLELERAENDRRNAAERRRLAEERAARRRKHQEAVRKKELQELQRKTLNALNWINKNRRKVSGEKQAAFDEALKVEIDGVKHNIDLFAISIADEMNWSSKYGATWKDLRQMYTHAKENDPNFLPSDDLDRIMKRLDSTQLEELNFDQLRDLYQAAVGLRTEFYNRNNVIGSEEYQIMEQVYGDSVEEMRTAPKKLKGLLDRFLNLEQMTPMNVFEEMGGFNPNGVFYNFAKQLEAGEKKVRSFTVRANKIMADFLEENEDWVRRADGQGKDGIWYEVEIPELIAMQVGEAPQFGGTVKVWMTPMQKIHLYLESRNYDNLRHMTGGRTFADKELYSKGERQEAFAKGTTIRMAPETVQMLVKDLTPQEMELARLLDKYYNDMAKTEINKVSNVLLGYDKAMGGKYAPIFTNSNYTKSEFGKFDGTAEGAGNLKERVKSKNPSYNISALDAFERNMDRTATYVGMAIPVRNWNTLMNWRTSNSSFADEITHNWGKGRLDYIQDLITDLQNPMGEQQDMVTEMSGKLLSNYISSVFGFNPSIVVKQLGSIPMASAYLGWKHFPKHIVGKGKIDRGLIGTYTQELDWRTSGYSMPETKQLKDAPNWSQKNKVVGLVFGGDAITAVDGWAASVLWPWAENYVRAEFPDLEVGDAAMIESGQSPFYKKVAEVFDDAVSRSQSVSDQMHQGRLRKSKHAAAKAFTMFRSDSAQSYNVLRQRLGELDYYRRKGKNYEEMADAMKKTVGAAATAVLINSLWGTAVDLLVKALKGKLEEEDKEPLAIVSDFFWGIVESYAGMSTFGDIAAETVGNWFTGGTSFDQEAPGVEQINDIIQAADKIVNAGKKGNMIGAIKIAAETIATMGYGLPTKNVEAYLMGLFSWALPGVKVSYEDLLKAPAKADLKGLKGIALETRLNHVLKGYGMELDRESREALAALYEAGYTEAVPSAAPDAVTVDGVEMGLDERMRKLYDKTRCGIIEQELPGVIGSAFFAEADEKTRKSMLTKLYNYAAEKAKADVLEGYDIGTTAQAIDEIVRSGGSAADYAVFDAATADMAAWQKAAVLQEWGTDEDVTKLMFKHLVSKSWEDELAELRKAGLDIDQFLGLYAKHGELDSRDLSAKEKATEFAYWLDGQRYTDRQKDAIKDQMVYFQMMRAKADRYNAATAAGLDREQALELAEGLEGTEKDIEKWRVAIDQSINEANQLKMLQSVGMTGTTYEKVEKAYEMGLAPAAWVRAKELEKEADEDGSGGVSQKEYEKLIDSMTAFGIVLPGDNSRFNLTTDQKAVLWQMLTGSKSSKNNPYSKSAGQSWLDAMGYE